MVSGKVVVSNKLGLHARASAKLTQLAGKYRSDVTLIRQGRSVNAKSIMGVMMLAAGLNSELEIQANGEDEQAALSALTALFNDKFGEDE